MVTVMPAPMRDGIYAQRQRLFPTTIPPHFGFLDARHGETAVIGQGGREAQSIGFLAGIVRQQPDESSLKKQ